MYARATISTATKDRVGDVLIPAGCNLKNYEKNPVVLWGHGIEGLAMPIGTSADGNGSVDVTITDDEVQAGCYFSQSLVEAQQIFELIDEGIVRATSVRETPIKSRLMMHQGEQVLLVEEWELEEWSWCCIGVNPDSVAKTLHRNRLGGKPIVESIMKSLNAVMPTKKTRGVGFTEIKSMADDEKKPDPDETPADEAAEGDAGQQPYGAQLMGALHSGVSQLIRLGEKGMGAMEHPEATPASRAFLDALKDAKMALAGAHSTCYPKSKLKDDMGDESADDDTEMKAFLAAGNVGRYQIAGIESQLKSLAGESNLTVSQKRSLRDLANSLNRLSTQAKSFKPVVEKKIEEKATPTISPEDQAKLDAAFAKLNAS